MKSEAYLRLKRDESSPWILAKQELLLVILEKFSSHRSEILDVGCGMGGPMRCLEKAGFQVFGIDKYRKAVEFCRKRNLVAKCGLAEKIPFPESSFDVIIALELLEHLNKPPKAIEEFARVLKPNGLLIVSVPAFNFFWNALDEMSRHFKRYTASILKKEINPVFEPLKVSYIFFSAFFPMLVLRFFRKSFKEKKGELFKDEFPDKLKFFEALILVLFRFENFLLKWIDFPFGVGVVGVFKNNKQ